ncbi:MAG: pirin family protein [Lautropia sp.]
MAGPNTGPGAGPGAGSEAGPDAEPGAAPVRLRIDAPLHDLGDGISVRRVLPSPARLAVGPFVLLDHLGPVTLPAEVPFDVRPHPHIGLATLTYLWEGRVEHRDGLGVTQTIEPGTVNLMSAGAGIVHSERTDARDRGKPRAMHGLQIWLVPPLARETDPPTFTHTTAAQLPTLQPAGARAGSGGAPRLRLVAGTAFGERSPVPVAGELFYVDVQLPDGASVPLDRTHRQRAIYVVGGTVRIRADGGIAGADSTRADDGTTRVDDGTTFGTASAGTMLLFEPAAPVRIEAIGAAHLVMLGGAPIDAPRHLWWNFAASSAERIEQAKRDWTAFRWPMVTGDDEFIPLPAPHERTLVTLHGDW